MSEIIENKELKFDELDRVNGGITITELDVPEVQRTVIRDGKIIPPNNSGSIREGYDEKGCKIH